MVSEMVKYVWLVIGKLQELLAESFLLCVSIGSASEEVLGTLHRLRKLLHSWKGIGVYNMESSSIEGLAPKKCRLMLQNGFERF